MIGRQPRWHTESRRRTASPTGLNDIGVVISCNTEADWKSVDVSKVNKNRARGVEVKIISRLLGHASVEIACNRYIHFFGGDIGDTLRQAVGA